MLFVFHSSLQQPAQKRWQDIYQAPAAEPGSDSDEEELSQHKSPQAEDSASLHKRRKMVQEKLAKCTKGLATDSGSKQAPQAEKPLEVASISSGDGDASEVDTKRLQERAAAIRARMWQRAQGASNI